jgi:hypothetical protein
LVKYQTQTIRKILSEIGSQYYLPPIQRTFVWNEERIEKLFDSILRGYPISTFLFWTTKDALKLRRFIENYVDGIDLDLFRVAPNDSKKTLILDGQQRLQSLFVGAEGTYGGKELHFDPLSGSTVDPETGMRYRFSFLGKDDDKTGWVKFKDILHQEPKLNTIRNFMVKSLKDGGIKLAPQQETLVDDNASDIVTRFMIDEILAYNEIDSITGPIKDINEIYEIFVRANSGGVQLTKSDLVFSTIVLEWADADSNIEKLVRVLNRGGRFSFDNDFAIKSCLTFVGAGARYDIQKLRGQDGKVNLNKIKKSWDTISDSLKSVVDLLEANGISSDNVLYSNNALIPIAYFAFVNGGKISYKEVHNAFVWLCIALLNRDFSGQSDTVIDNCKDAIDAQHSKFPHDELDQALPKSKRIGFPADLSQWSGGESLMLNLIYRPTGGVNFKPLITENEPEMDHIFPKSKLQKLNFDKSMINNIANFRYVSDKENRDKTDEDPDVWFENLKDAASLSIHLIPANKDLWKLTEYPKFLDARGNEVFSVLQNTLKYK